MGPALARKSCKGQEAKGQAGVRLRVAPVRSMRPMPRPGELAQGMQARQPGAQARAPAGSPARHARRRRASAPAAPWGCSGAWRAACPGWPSCSGWQDSVGAATSSAAWGQSLPRRPSPVHVRARGWPTNLSVRRCLRVRRLGNCGKSKSCMASELCPAHARALRMHVRMSADGACTGVWGIAHAQTEPQQQGHLLVVQAVRASQSCAGTPSHACVRGMGMSHGPCCVV